MLMLVRYWAHAHKPHLHFSSHEMPHSRKRLTGYVFMLLLKNESVDYTILSSPLFSTRKPHPESWFSNQPTTCAMRNMRRVFTRNVRILKRSSPLDDRELIQHTPGKNCSEIVSKRRQIFDQRLCGTLQECNFVSPCDQHHSPFNKWH